MHKNRKLLWGMMIVALLLSGCKNNRRTSSSSSSGIVAELSNYAELYETTGTKAKMLSRENDLEWVPYEITGNNEIHVYTDTDKEELTGFGFAMTHSTAYWLQNMSPALKQQALEDLLLPSGANLNIIRIPLGTSDFTYTNDFYTFNDTIGFSDYDLNGFSIERDLEYLIPSLKDALLIKPDLIFFAAPWSAPGWMKTTGILRGGSLVEGSGTTPSNEEISYAKYLFKALEAYRAHDINIKYISLVNEPNIGFVNYPCMSMDAYQFARVAKLLGRHIKSAGYDTTIMGYDHNAGDPSDEIIFEQWTDLVNEDAELSSYVSSYGFHCYSQGWQDGHRDFLKTARMNNPDKKLFVTEITESATSGVDFALNLAWSMKNVTVGPLSSGANAAIYWNGILDANGKPIKGNTAVCYGLLTYDGTSLYRNPAFYSLAHNARYLYPIDGVYPVRVDSYADNEAKINTATYRRADGAHVTVIVNIDSTTYEDVSVVYDEDKMLSVRIQAESAVTIVTPKEPVTTPHQSISVENFTLTQQNARNYDFELKLSHRNPNMKFYLTPEQEAYKPSDLFPYSLEGSNYHFDLDNIDAGNYSLHMVLDDLSGVFNFTIPHMNPRADTQPDGSVLIQFEFDPKTSWSSYCDPYGKNIYRSSKHYYDESATLVNVDTSGNHFPIYITDESFTDNHPDNNEPYYFIVLTSKNGLGTIISYPLISQEHLIGSTSARLEVKAGVPFLIVKLNGVAPENFDKFRLVVKDNVVDIHFAEYDANLGVGEYHFDLTQIRWKGIWYDILIEYKSNSNRYDLLAESADLTQAISVGGDVYKFEEWEGLLKVHKVK